jgi:hypothetical protein
MRNEIVRWFKFPEGGWNLWSEMDGTVCKILCDKMVSWPTGATSVQKRRIWEKTIAPRLGRKLSLIKNKISQKMREVFMSKYSCMNVVKEAVYDFSYLLLWNSDGAWRGCPDTRKTQGNI